MRWAAERTSSELLLNELRCWSGRYARACRGWNAADGKARRRLSRAAEIPAQGAYLLRRRTPMFGWMCVPNGLRDRQACTGGAVV